MPSISDSEPVPVPSTSIPVPPSTLSSFEAVFGGEISPMDEHDGWLVDTGPEGTIRAPFQSNVMAGFHLEYSNSFGFEGLEFG